MSRDRTGFRKKDINEQIEYLQDVFYMMLLEVYGEDSPERFLDMCSLSGRHLRTRMTESMGERALREIERLRQEVPPRKAAFEKKLKEEPDRYPLSRLFKKMRLNAYERFLVTTTAAVALMTAGSSRRGGCPDIRTLAALYESSTVKRVDAELYFQGECKLVDKGMLLVDGVIPCQQHYERDVRISRKGYLAVLGRCEEGSEGDDAGSYGSESGSRRSRMERGRSLGELSEPRLKLSSVVLPPETRKQVLMAIEQARNHDVIFSEWGLGRQVGRGRSPSLLFAGPPGTGKTHTSEAVARELGMKMLMVKGSDMVSPWHGEDEMRAAVVFRQANDEEALLVFDEADSFFYARHSVMRSIDQSSNRTVNVFLGCLEEHELPVILTTNRANALDPALERRLALKVVFNPPGEKERVKIWRLHLPRKMPLADDVDITALAERYPVTGGQIKNAVLTAAREAVYRRSRSDGKVEVTMEDLEGACRAELTGSDVFGTSEREIGFCLKDKAASRRGPCG